MSFRDLVYQFVDLINITIPVLGGLALLLFLFGLARYVYKSGDAKGKSAEKEMIKWGLLALFVIFSIGGILQVLKGAFPYTTESAEGGGRPGGAEMRF